MSTKPILLISFLLSFTIASAQEKDSLTLEMERLNRMGDSLHKEQLKRDSAFQDMLNKIPQDIENIKNETKQKEIDWATEQVIKQHEKEQASKRRIYWIGFIILLVITTATGVYLQRKKNKA